jgi:predicted DNA-binding transcriptional regulator AlpA
MIDTESRRTQLNAANDQPTVITRKRRDTARQDDALDSYKLLDARQVADILGITPTRLCIWRSQGLGPRWCAVGRLVRYRRQAVLDWIHVQEQQPEPARPVHRRKIT